MDRLRHLQNVILGIVKDIDELCKKNGIEYYLLGGSAIGAIRHKGFIPWDDDLDIIMSADNYDRFIDVCRNQLDQEKYYLQVGLDDWPMYFTKVKLRGTHMKEVEGETIPEEHNGIYVDIFRLDNAPTNRVAQYVQYFLAKLFLCYQLSERTYKSASLKKRTMIALSFPLKWHVLRNAVKKYIEHYNKRDCDYWAFFYGRTNFSTCFVEKRLYGNPLRVIFEDTMLPVPEHYDEYLTQMFGDYMTPPPVEKRVGLHLIDVDFGKY